MKTPDPLPWPEIDDLIDNKMYRNRYWKLIKAGYQSELLWLAVFIAPQKAEPSHWFAWACSVRRWEHTLAYVKEYRTEVEQERLTLLAPLPPAPLTLI